MRLFFLFAAVFFTISATAQQKNQKAAKYWSDSVYQSLTPRERIAQLVVARLSTYDAKNKVSKSFFDEVLQLVKQYNIGGVCLFQGGPVYQARQLNELKANAKTPILCSIDAEWGLGMRLLDSVMPLPKQMMMGAMGDSSIVYEYGKIVANQCKRMGIQMNYAPVVDVNNNPDNPVINDRSFGEDKKKVAAFGIQYMKGMQDHGVMACAKHFPGHGDVNVDSHLDLPQINKSIPTLEQIELYPFRQIFSAGIGSVMIGHLYIPSIDNRTNRPTSLSINNVKGLLRDSIKYNGLAITDGLEMLGVKKFFSRGQSSVEAIRAGNDLLCIPDSIPMVIEAIENAIRKNILSEKDIEFHCKRVLMAKFEYVADQNNPVVLSDLTKDLNRELAMMRKKVAENAITLLSKNDYTFFPFRKEENKESIAFVGIGLESANTFSDAIQNNLGAKVFFIPASMKSRDSLDRILDEIVHNHCRVIVGIHNMSRNVAANFGLTAEQVRFTNLLQQRSRSIIFQFGNAYGIKNWCHAKNLVVCYEDDPITQETAYRMLIGEIPYKGSLPVSVCEQYKFGAGFFFERAFPVEQSDTPGVDHQKLNKIDDIIMDAIRKKAMPGCNVLAIKDGNILFQKAYGHYTYEAHQPSILSSVYDLASITKILATTLSLMRLYDEGKIDLSQKTAYYLPELQNSNIGALKIEKLLLHEAGLAAYTPYYKRLLTNQNSIADSYKSYTKKTGFENRITNNIYIRNDIKDSFYQAIIDSKVTENPGYVYSDNDFVLLGKIVERISGKNLDEYVTDEIYKPMGLHQICFLPYGKISTELLVPSIRDGDFRQTELRGFVHDPGAALFGGVAGHAGLFGNAENVAAIMQMLLNGGTWKGKKYLQRSTIELFTSYASTLSRRGLGFDKPEKDNPTKKDGYPSRYSSPKCFGHTGFTGTCVWADPEVNLIYVLLANRNYPAENDLFKTMNIRSDVLDKIYESIIP